MFFDAGPTGVFVRHDPHITGYFAVAQIVKAISDDEEIRGPPVTDAWHGLEVNDVLRHIRITHDSLLQKLISGFNALLQIVKSVLVLFE